MFEGSFDSETAKSFVAPLNDLLRVGISKLKININTDGVKIGAVSEDGNSLFVTLHYKADQFKGFKFPSVPFIFGVHDLSELVGIMKVFSEGFSLKVNKDLIVINHDDNKYIYYGVSEKKCPKGPSSLGNKTDPTAGFIWDEKMSSFMKALTMMKQEHIVFTGDKGKDTLDIAIVTSQFKKYNEFKASVTGETNTCDFRMVLDKNLFQPCVAGSVSEFNVKLFDRKMVVLQGNTDFYEICFAVSCKAKS
jgi:hypothetical protein